MKREQNAYLKVTLDLLSQLNKRILDFNVGQGIDLSQCIQTDLNQSMFASDMTELIDSPCSLMIANVGHSGVEFDE